MYEILMPEWNVSFHTIENEWTDDQFMALLEARNKRIEKENEAHERQTNRSNPNQGTTKMNHEQMLALVNKDK